MANLRADINALQAVKGQVHTQIQELESNILTLNEVLTALAPVWDGSASKAFLDAMQRYRSKAIKAVDCLTEYRNYITQVITRLEEQDRREQAIIRAMQQAVAARKRGST